MEITDAELKTKVKEAVDAAVNEATTGLKTKNTELLGKLKKAQKDSEIDPADHAALQQELDDMEIKLSESAKALKIAIKAADDSKKLYETEAGVAHNLLVDNGLNSALIANGVKNPVYLEAAVALLKGSVKLEADGDKRVAKVGDKALADYVKEWAEGEKGKVFVDAPGNVGGGAAGGNGSGKPDGKYENIKDPMSRLSAISADGGT